MKKKLTKRKPGQVSVHSGQVEFVKVNIGSWQSRDVYQWLLALRWPPFAALVATAYIALDHLQPVLPPILLRSMLLIVANRRLSAIYSDAECAGESGDDLSGRRHEN